MNYFKKFLPLLVIFSLMSGTFVLAELEFPSRVGQREGLEIAPQFEFVAPREREKISGEVKIKGRVKDANSVEFYYQTPGASFPIYLASAQPKGENLWEYSWDTI